MVRGKAALTEKDSFLRAVNPAGGARRGEPPPFIVPGSLVSPARPGGGGLFSPPQAVQDAAGLAALSMRIHDTAGIMNTGVPFTMRVESEAYGGETDDGLSGGGWDGPYPLAHVSQFAKRLAGISPWKGRRARLAAGCIRELSERRPDVPTIADVCGPLSLATSLIHAKGLLKSLANEPDVVHDFLAFLSRNTAAYARSLVEAGATAVCITDPFATVETLGLEGFIAFAVPQLNSLTAAVQREGCPVIAHLCGGFRGDAAKRALGALRADCISVDACVSVSVLKGFFPRGRGIMGNISSVTLGSGTPGEIRAEVDRAIAEGVDILAPSCSLDGAAPVENMRAAREALDRAAGRRARQVT